MSKDDKLPAASASLIDPATTRERMPTPLYVTQKGKGVMLKYSTQEDADRAARILGALATEAANVAHEARKELENSCKKGIHQYGDEFLARHQDGTIIAHMCNICGYTEEVPR